MKRPARPEELQLWARVAETVKPMPGRTLPRLPDLSGAATDALPPKLTGRAPAATPAKPLRARVPPPPAPLEPNRARRVVREHDPIAGRLDLHGLTVDHARPTLERFIFAAFDRGDRVVLVITGKGNQGEGIIRRLTPEWLSAPPLRAMIAGVQPAHRRHGGDGALYVAIKRRA
ncbi:MAG: DNA mismatch repair protein MutS [Caulobacter sp.]|nr:DNA mismatch repair protein MutS [Caulobacter sp.]